MYAGRALGKELRMNQDNAPNLRYIPPQKVCVSCKHFWDSYYCLIHKNVNLKGGAGSKACFYVCDDFEEDDE